MLRKIIDAIITIAFLFEEARKEWRKKRRRAKVNRPTIDFRG